MPKTLVAYYSRAGENYVSGEMKQLKVGNTEVTAGMIAEFTHADLFKIEQTQSYSKSYNECIAQAQEDQRRDARPALKEYPDSLDEYDVIYLGYPNYWSNRLPQRVSHSLRGRRCGGGAFFDACDRRCGRAALSGQICAVPALLNS